MPVNQKHVVTVDDTAVIRTFDHWIIELHPDQEYPGTCRGRLRFRRIFLPQNLCARERAELYETVSPSITEALRAVLSWSRDVYERWVGDADGGAMLFIPLARGAKVPILDRPVPPSEFERRALVYKLRTHLRS